LEVTTNGPQCRESVYGITTTKVVTTIGVESVPQRKNIFAKSNSSSWLFKKFWEFSNSEMITQKSRKLLLRNSKIRVKKQFGGYSGTYLLVPGYKNLSSRRREIQILVGLGRTVEKIKI
jgi:hypothetical protein